MVDLKGLLPKKDKTEHYWSIVLEKDLVQAGIWKVVEGNVVMVSTSPPAAWGSADELINAADSVLSSSVSELSEEAQEPSKTVFAVPNSWSSDGQIKQEYLEQIKEVCQKLELIPVGFVVLSEAISHFLKSEEGVLVSAILVGLGKEEIELSLVRTGKVVGETQVLRSMSLDEDVTEGIARISDAQSLPSRVVLYDGKEGDLEEAKQSLINTDWTKHPEISFLHSPKIETIESKSKVYATALAGGAEIAGAQSVMPSNEESGYDASDVKNVSEQLVDKDSDPMSLEQTGFVVNQDIAKPKEIEKPAGMVQDGSSLQDNLQKSVSEEAGGQITQKPKMRLIQKVLGKMNSFKQGITKTISRSGANKVAIFGGLFIILFLILGFLGWWFLPKAQVTVYLSPNQLEELVSIYVDPDKKSVDLDTKTLPGQVLKEEVKGSKTATTTGTKTVGEKAKGAVTIYRVGSGLDLDAGTTLQNTGEIIFTLDNDISIASGSASSPSTTNVNVTAKNIGADSNLASGESFSISNYPTSELEAKNDNDFTGGSSREISSVSEKDENELLASLQEELEGKVRDQFKKSVDDNLVSSDNCSDGCVFIEDSIVSSVTQKDYSDKVGDEATTLKLDLAVEVAGLIVDRKSLIDVANETFKEKVPTGYVLREEQISMKFSYDKEVDGVYSLNVTVLANLLPELNIEEIKKAIAGRLPEIAKETVSGIPGFERIEILLKPRFPGRLGTLPRIVGNIEVEVAAEK